MIKVSRADFPFLIVSQTDKSTIMVLILQPLYYFNLFYSVDILRCLMLIP